MPNPDFGAPRETGALIDYILSRYHEKHRTKLAHLQVLAQQVVEKHANAPQVPRGLVWALVELAEEVEMHMAKEEFLLFPAMRRGGMAEIDKTIRIMRADHNSHAENVALIQHITNKLVPPEHACRAWRNLYHEIRIFLSDLQRHVALENDELFPRFERK